MRKAVSRTKVERGRKPFKRTTHKIGRAVFIRRRVRPAIDDDSLAATLLETARDMQETGLMDKATHDKITMRHLKENPEFAMVREISPEQIRQMREMAHLSQGVFAQLLNVTSGYVSQIERGDKKPTGSTLKLLSVIKNKGIDPLL